MGTIALVDPSEVFGQRFNPYRVVLEYSLLQQIHILSDIHFYV